VKKVLEGHKHAAPVGMELCKGKNHLDNELQRVQKEGGEGKIQSLTHNPSHNPNPNPNL
jgi:hypothetical protein